MNKCLEIETKYLLSKEDYYLLFAYFKKDLQARRIQTNYYFDTPTLKLYTEHQSFLRVRQESDGDLILTLKSPLLSGLLETNVSLTQNDFDAMLKGNIPNSAIKELLANYQIDKNNLTYLAQLETKRISFKYKAGKLFLDESKYNGITDYEIEFETKSTQYGEKVLKDLFNHLNITPLSKNSSKFMRAVTTKDKQKG